MTPKEEIIFSCMADPCKAHDTFFHHRHAAPPAAFHRQLERDFHSEHPRILWLVFRGGAKSTKLEEGTALEVAMQRVKNVLILGESEQRACERLAAIKHIIEFDEDLQTVFGVEPGDPWAETRACTNTGIILQAAGRGQSLRGVKHLNYRPDLILLDDIEDVESGAVATPDARKKVRDWLTKTVIPAAAKYARIRMAATPIHPEALAPTLAKTSVWKSRTVPIIYPDSAKPGVYLASWPEQFPVEWALEKQREYEAIGQHEAFVQEYMCEAVDQASRVFTEDMIRVVHREPSWHATYAIYDPARTTDKTSATTGKVVASWIGRKLIVWQASAERWLPSDIVEDMFATDERYSPVVIGVEETGLNEWLMQPIRTEQLRRGRLIPLRSLNAPKGKLDFIKGLQPYFRAGDVEFAQELPELRSQLLGFPTGHIDAPNALAYMLKLKLGIPIYEGFREAFVSPDSLEAKPKPCWLAVNTDNRVTTAVLAQLHAGVFRILADWVVEGEPGVQLTDIIDEAMLRAVSSPETSKGGLISSHRLSQSPLRLLAPPHHFQEMSLYGLRAICRSLNLRLYQGVQPVIGRDEVRKVLRGVTSQGSAALQIDPAARWTLRAFAGGYARDVTESEPQATPYAVLMAALESCIGLKSAASTVDSDVNFAYTSDGRRYISALAR